jgi:hypothetical protein
LPQPGLCMAGPDPALPPAPPRPAEPPVPAPPTAPPAPFSRPPLPRPPSPAPPPLPAATPPAPPAPRPACPDPPFPIDPEVPPTPFMPAVPDAPPVPVAPATPPPPEPPDPTFPPAPPKPAELPPTLGVPANPWPSSGTLGEQAPVASARAATNDGRPRRSPGPMADPTLAPPSAAACRAPDALSATRRLTEGARGVTREQWDRRGDSVTSFEERRGGVTCEIGPACRVLLGPTDERHVAPAARRNDRALVVAKCTRSRKLPPCRSELATGRSLSQ